MTAPRDDKKQPRLLPVDKAAVAYAKRWNLVTDQGEVVCLRDGCGQSATLPSLLCRQHLAAHRRGYHR